MNEDTTGAVDRDEAWALARALVTAWGANDADGMKAVVGGLATFLFHDVKAPPEAADLLVRRVFALSSMLAAGTTQILNEFAEVTGEPAQMIWQRMSLPGPRP